MDIYTLCNECIVHIMTFLELKEVFYWGLTASKFAVILGDEIFWAQKLYNDFLQSTKVQAKSCKEYYKCLFSLPLAIDAIWELMKDSMLGFKESIIKNS